MVRAFDPIPKVKARPDYQLLYGTKILHIPLLYLFWLIILFKQTTCVEAKTWLATLNHSQSGKGVLP